MIALEGLGVVSSHFLTDRLQTSVCQNLSLAVLNCIFSGVNKVTFIYLCIKPGKIVFPVYLTCTRVCFHGFTQNKRI